LYESPDVIIYVIILHIGAEHMDANSALLIRFLSLSVRALVPEHELYQEIQTKIMDNTISWDTLYQEAFAHQVHGLLYPVISALPKDCCESETLLRWQRGTVLAGLHQLEHMEQMDKVLFGFYEKRIPVVALKGLVLRYYYPKPELRTMGDADLLVHKEDVEKSKALLLSLGYKITFSYSRHISFSYLSYPLIELHWALSDTECREATSEFTDSIWERVQETTINKAPALCLSVEDQILHLLFHTAHHTMTSGFGLRQLCDFVVILEKAGQAIDWDFIQSKTEVYGIQKFSLTIFWVCHMLFDTDVSWMSDNPVKDSDYVDLLIEDVLNAGVYGRKLKSREASSQFMKYIDIRDNPSELYRIGNKLRFLFPAPDKISIKYGYAKRFPVLLPLAWLHRAFCNIKKLSAYKGMKSNGIETITQNRASLLKWLELH
jgi:hypothetical protein